MNLSQILFGVAFENFVFKAFLKKFGGNPGVSVWRDKMNKKLFEAKIERHQDTLRIEMTYERVHTKEDDEVLHKLYDKIYNPVKVGEKEVQSTGFTVTFGKNIYAGLYSINKNNPSVLPDLIKKLREYKPADDVETSLVNHAVSELEKIINSK